jgi:hypothetical protein
MVGCGGSIEFDLDQRAVDGYRSREDAQAAAQDHIRALAAEGSPDLCPGKCAAKTSHCKAVVLDDDLAGAVRTFMHRDDDGDPSFGWLIGGTITVHCACVEKRRPNKPVSATAPGRAAATGAATAPGTAVTGAAVPEKPVHRKPARKTTGRPQSARRRSQT